MIVNEDEALARLASPNNLINKLGFKNGAASEPQATGSITGSIAGSIDSFLDSTTESIVEEEADIPSNAEVRELYSNRTGPKNIPPIIQTLAVETAAVSSERAAAEDFGISHQTVGYYKNGGGDPDRQRIKDNVKKVHADAIDVMLGSIGVLKEKLEKREIKKATDLSKIAADMGRVINRTTPKDVGASNVKVIVFAPNLKSEDQYEEMIINN